jgi:hypothetical protein
MAMAALILIPVAARHRRMKIVPEARRLALRAAFCAVFLHQAERYLDDLHFRHSQKDSSKCSKDRCQADSALLRVLPRKAGTATIAATPASQDPSLTAMEATTVP